MLLEVNKLSVKYGKISALNAVSLAVRDGELTTLLGANGAGKSTLLKTISGLLRPYSGEIVYQGPLAGLARVRGSATAPYLRAKLETKRHGTDAVDAH